jgi:hypothetical protein
MPTVGSPIEDGAVLSSASKGKQLRSVPNFLVIDLTYAGLVIECTNEGKRMDIVKEQNPGPNSRPSVTDRQIQLQGAKERVTERVRPKFSQRLRFGMLLSFHFPHSVKIIVFPLFLACSAFVCNTITLNFILTMSDGCPSRWHDSSSANPLRTLQQ